MAWATSLTTAVLVSQRNSTSRVYSTNILTGLRRHRDQTSTTTVEEYWNMTQAAATAAAASMDSDTQDVNQNRTVVTSEVSRQNEADAYKITKTTAYTSAWSDWSDYY